MTTLLAKASSFLGNGAFPVSAHWPRPGQESTRQNVPGSILVSVQGQATMRAGVTAHRQTLADICSTPATQLARTSRIYSHHRRTGACSLVRQDPDKAGPASVRDCSAHPLAPQHPTDVQAFHCDKPVATGQVQSGLEVMFVPLVSNASMQDTDDFDGLVPIFAASLLAADSALRATQGRKFFLEEARVIDDTPVRGGQEFFYADVDTDSRQGAGLNRNNTEVAGQNFERLTHVLFTLLSFDVMSNASFGNCTTRTSVITTTPKSRKTRAQRRELCTQVMRRSPFEACDQFSDAPCRVRLYEKMHVVGHDFERVNSNAKLRGNLVQKDRQALLNILDKNGPAVLGAPHDVILECEDRAAILSILTHTDHYKHADKLINRRERGAAIPLSAKADSGIAA